MKYRDMLGFSKKKAKKKVIPEQPKPSVTAKLKEEFGSLNEWSEKPTGPKRWFKPMDKEGLTEFEKSQMNEYEISRNKLISTASRAATKKVKSSDDPALWSHLFHTKMDIDLLKYLLLIL